MHPGRTGGRVGTVFAHGATVLPNENLVRDQAARCLKPGQFHRCEKKSGWALFWIVPATLLDPSRLQECASATGLIKAILVPVHVLKTKKMASSGQQRLVIFPKEM